MPIKLFYRFSKKSVRLVFRIIEVLLALIIVMGGLIFWRLSVAPMNVDFLVPELVDKMVPKDVDVKVDVRSIILRAAVKDDGILHLEIKDLTVLRPDGTVITDLPNIEMSYGLWRILTLNYMPDTLTIKNALLQAILDEEGNLYLQSKTVPENQSPALAKPDESAPVGTDEVRRTKEVPVAGADIDGPDLSDSTDQAAQAKRSTTADHTAGGNPASGAASALSPDPAPVLVSDADRFVGYLLSFKRLELENAQMVLEDRRQQKEFSVPSLNVLIEQENMFQYALQADATVSANNSAMHVGAKALFNKSTHLMDFEIDFDSVNLSKLSRFSAVLSEAKLSVKGAVMGKLDLSKRKENIRESVSELSFKIQNERPGSVNLPAPLTNEYKVTTLLIQGAFAPGLDTLKIDQSKLTTGSTSATLSVDVTGLGAFLDKGDLSVVKTVLKSTVKNVKTEEVPGLWPAALGPDAHAWVKKNLSQGGISTADFTLYFTGDTLDDLFGDIKASGISVDYLAPMPPVHDVAATVELYPDTVKIFANSGSLNGITLKKADLYLTDLQADISHAQVELTASGPVQDMMKVIDSKPLEFASAFDLNPDKTAGSATVSAAFSFPLQENIKISQVKVNVDADIQNGVFPTPLEGVSVEKGNFKLLVDNNQLTLDGSAEMKEMPLNLKWAERFNANQKNPLQTHYVLSGTVSNDMLRKWVQDIDGYMKGTVPMNIDVQKDFKGHMDIDAHLDLTAAEVPVYPLSVVKEARVPATLNINAAVKGAQIPQVFNFNFEAPKKPIEIKGKVNLTNGFSLWLDRVRAPLNEFTGKVIIDRKLNSDIAIKGKSWNISKLFDMPLFKKEPSAESGSKAESEQIPNIQIAPPNIALDVNLNTLILDPQKPLKFVLASGVRRGYYWRNLHISAKGSDNLEINYIPQTRQLRGETGNLGDLLARLGATKRFFGGRLKLNATQNSGGNFVGEITVRDFNLKDPGFIIQAVTILGIVDGIRGKELNFKRARIPFELTPYQTVFIKEGYANGTTLGITFEGRVSLSKLALNGSVIPAYLINSLLGRIPVVGNLFKDGAGGGLVGVKYELTGTAFKPVVTFNPLSSIAPGVLGRFFK